MKRGKGLRGNLSEGLIAIKKSLIFLIVLDIISIFYLLLKGFNVSDVMMTIFRLPNSGDDYSIILAGTIIFIVLPFVLGFKRKI